jgi:hypothetical protein
VIDRRRVSVQWFSGTILTGLCGAALIGGAVFASLDGEMTFRQGAGTRRGRAARRVRRQRPRRQPAQERPPAAAERIDRRAQRGAGLHRHPRRQPRRDAGAAVHPHLRQSVDDDQRSQRQDPAVQRPAHADRCRHRRAAAADDPNAADAVEPDAEVSFVTKDLATVLPKAKIAAVVALDDILMRVRDAANWRGNSGGALRRAGQCRRRRQRRAVRHQAGLRHRRQPSPPIPMPASRPAWCRKTSRCCRRPRIRSPAAIPTANASTSSRRATASPRSCATRAPRRKRPRRSPPTLGPRGRDGGLKEGQKLRILMAPAGPGPAAAALPRDRRQRHPPSRRSPRCPISANTSRSTCRA